MVQLIILSLRQLHLNNHRSNSEEEVFKPPGQFMRVQCIGLVEQMPKVQQFVPIIKPITTPLQTIQRNQWIWILLLMELNLNSDTWIADALQTKFYSRLPVRGKVSKDWIQRVGGTCLAWKGNGTVTKRVIGRNEKRDLGLVQL